MNTPKNTVTINGKQYDALSGLPMEATTSVASTTSTAGSARSNSSRQPATHHRAKPHRSQTLRRDMVKKPVGQYETVTVRAKRTPAQVAKSPQISRFGKYHTTLAPHVAAPRSTTSPKKVRKTVKDQETVSPLVAAVQRAASDTTAKPTALSSRELKSKLIADKMAHSAPKTHVPKRKHRPLLRPLRIGSMLAGATAFVMLGAYLTYISMPNLSVRIAAAQAGVAASYPSYTPNGYRLDGPVAYQEGEVKLAFTANGGTTGYEIAQQKSSWDSGAVLDNYIAPQSKNYTANSASGLTVYTYDHNAAWVNNGTLYTIEGDAPLSTEQVLRIAESM